MASHVASPTHIQKIDTSVTVGLFLIPTMVGMLWKRYHATPLIPITRRMKERKIIQTMAFTLIRKTFTSSASHSALREAL